MGRAALDVVRVELVVELERRGEAFELGQHPAPEAAAPELAGLFR